MSGLGILARRRRVLGLGGGGRALAGVECNVAVGLLRGGGIKCIGRIG